MTKSEENLLSMDHYVRKTFFKTASLMANSCRAVAVLGGGGDATAQAAWDYGRNLGLAFQVCSSATSVHVRGSPSRSAVGPLLRILGGCGMVLAIAADWVHTC